MFNELRVHSRKRKIIYGWKSPNGTFFKHNKNYICSYTYAYVECIYFTRRMKKVKVIVCLY